MKTGFSLIVVGVLAGAAAAQPGQTLPEPYPPPPPQPYPQPYPTPQQQPPPGYQVPPPYAYQPPRRVQLTGEEIQLLQDGDISDGAHLAGGVASVFLGLGLGQAIQGRWSDTGWIFTLGETASYVALMAGVVSAFSDCINPPGPGTTCNNSNSGEGLFFAGLAGLLVFRAWDIVDAFTGPPKHNNRVRELRMRLGIPQPMYTKLAPYLNKSRDGGGVAGVSFSF